VLAGPRRSGALWLCEVLGLASSLRLLPCDVEGREFLGGDGPRSSFATSLSKLECFFFSAFLVLNVGKGLSQLIVVGDAGLAGRIRSLAMVNVSCCRKHGIADHIVATTTQAGFTHVLTVTSSPESYWVARVGLPIFSHARWHVPDHWIVALFGYLGCENVHHTGTNDWSVVVEVFGHIVGEDSHCRSGGKVLGMAPHSVADIVGHHNIHSVHIAGRYSHFAQRRDHGKHQGFAEYIHHSLRALNQHAHLLCLLVVQSIR
jgi:hypothetical protein